MKIILVFVVVAILAGYVIGGFFNSQTIYVYNHSNPEIRIIKQKELVHVPIPGNISYKTIYVPAVDENDVGVVTEISVQSLPGTGKTLTNIDKILFWVDTQNSIRIAREVGGKLAEVDINKYDLIYTITANATVIEGPSAGAAMTIATVAALLNRDINPGVMITGTVESDGRIGPVGSVDSKIRAAKEFGARVILVPKGLGFTTLRERVEKCEIIGGEEFCRIEYVNKRADAGERYGIEVKEISTIEEGLNYFFL